MAKAKPKKETSDRASKLAGFWLQEFKKTLRIKNLTSQQRRVVRELMTVCASALAQDQTRGRRK